MEAQAAQAPAAGEMIILQNKRHGEIIRRSFSYVVNLEMDNSLKMGSLLHSKRSDNKQCTVKVKWGIFIENLTVFFYS